MSRVKASNAELDWAAKAFEKILGMSTFQSDKAKKHLLHFLMEAPDSIKARVTEFEAIDKIGE